MADDDKMRPLVRKAGESRRCGEGRFPLACAFRCAAAGVAYAFRSQRNLKIQVVLGLGEYQLVVYYLIEPLSLLFNELLVMVVFYLLGLIVLI